MCIKSSLKWEELSFKDKIVIYRYINYMFVSVIIRNNNKLSEKFGSVKNFV